MSNKELKVLEKINTDVNVGMDEVVTVFLSRWEDTLYAKKEELSKEIKRVKKEIEDHVKVVLDQFKLQSGQYEHTIPSLSIKSKVTNVALFWKENDVGYGEKFKTPNARFTVEIKDNEKSDEYRSSSSFTKYFRADISDSDVERHKSLEEEHSELSTELSEILLKIKGIGRKERQVRGKIAEMKLEQGGYSELLENPEMVQLVKLD